MRSVSLLHISLAVVTCTLGFNSPVDAQPAGYEGYQVVEIEIADEAELETLRGLRQLGRGFQVWSETARIGSNEVRVSPTARRQLDKSELCYEVAIDDLQHYLDGLYAGAGEEEFFNSLRTYDEHVQFMTDLATTYPNLAEMFNVGFSVRGREMWALRITGEGDVKPGVFFHGAEHGNEQAPASVVAYVAHHLLTNYDSDPEVKELVDHAEWYLMPIMNPDGYIAYDRWNAHGVDLNRNWDGPGCCEDPWGGPYPFSEPETAAVRDFLLAHPKVRVHVDLHGYVPWIMWVWGHIPDHSPDHARFESVGIVLRQGISDAGGGWYDIGTIYDVAYWVSGCSTNYTYGELSLWAFALEVVDATMPTICEEFLSSMLYFGEWIWDTDCNGNGVDDPEDISNGTSRDCNSTQVPDECEAIDSGDFDADGNVELDDFAAFTECMAGPDTMPHPPMLECVVACLAAFDLDLDNDVDFGDFAVFQALFNRAP